MNIVVVMRQVPDLIEPLEVADSGDMLDLDGAAFLVNETDDHALEQALLLKEDADSLTVVALDYGDIDNTLYAAVAKGVDRVVKIPYDEFLPPVPRVAATLYAEVIGKLDADLVLTGVTAYDELEGSLAPLLAEKLKRPYVGVIRGVRRSDASSTLTVFKEFPAAVLAQMAVDVPAVLGILAADQPPRYVAVNRIRSAMKSAQFEECSATTVAPASGVTIQRLYAPAVSQRARMIAGTEEEVATELVDVLAEKGIVR